MDWRRRFDAKDRNLINKYYYESTLHHLLCHRLHTSHHLLFHRKRDVDMVARRNSHTVPDRGMRMSVSSGEKIQQKTIHVDLKGPVLRGGLFSIAACLPDQESRVCRYRLSGGCRSDSHGYREWRQPCGRNPLSENCLRNPVAASRRTPTAT